MTTDRATSARNAGAPTPRSPLDPYVEQVVRWVGQTPSGVSSIGIGAAIAAAMDWPPPFAEAILASVRARKLLRVHRAGTRSVRLGLSRRGEAWLAELAERQRHEE
jgi:hypothetical protein